MGHKNYTKYNKIERKEFNEEVKQQTEKTEEPVKVPVVEVKTEVVELYEVYVNHEDDQEEKVLVNVRQKPETNAYIITSLPEETLVRVNRMVDDKWASIVYKDGLGQEHSGFMMRQYIREVE